jgi:hypothetical protein
MTTPRTPRTRARGAAVTSRLAKVPPQENRLDPAASAGGVVPPPAAAPAESTMLVTLVLKHHPGLTLEDVQSRLKASDWWEQFPPPGVEIVSWTVAMGLGQIATLRLTPDRLPALNLELERRGWGVFATECHPTYDFVPVRERIRERVRAGGQ